MARNQVTVDVKAKIATYTAKSLKDFTGEAKKLANQPTHSGLQTELAIMFYVGQKKAGKNAFDGNKAIFVPFCTDYYGPGKGLQRAELKGFSPDGKHTAKSSALTLLRGYEHFAAAGKVDGDMVPAIRAILEAGDEVAKKGIAAKGAMLSKLIEAAKGGVPKGDAVKEAIDKVNNAPAGAKPNPVVTAARALRSRAKDLASDAEFKAALNPPVAVQFNAMVEAIVTFAQIAIGAKAGKAGENEATTNAALLAAAAALTVPAPKGRGSRKGTSN